MNMEQIYDFEQKIKEIEIDLLLPVRMTKIADENVLNECFVILENINDRLSIEPTIDRLFAGKIKMIYDMLRAEVSHGKSFTRLKEMSNEFENYILKIFNTSCNTSSAFASKLNERIDEISDVLTISAKDNKMVDKYIVKDFFDILEDAVKYFSIGSLIERSFAGRLLKIYFILQDICDDLDYHNKFIMTTIDFNEFINQLLPHEVSFGRDIDAYNHFSNYSYFGFTLKNKYWKTVAHYYQAMKFENTKYEEEIRLLETPEEAEQLGKSTVLSLRADWKSVRDSIMKEAVFEKFQSNSKLKELLLSTRYEDIAYNGLEDLYWGAGRAANGKNVLGRIVMETRRILRSKQKGW